MAMVKPFEIAVSDETLDRIRAKVAGYTWHEMPEEGGWAYGSNPDYMRELCAYWLKEFDWRAQETKINRYSHFIAPVKELDIHFIHEKGSGPAPLPLLISHGWPGSVVEFLEVIEPLAHPERFGGRFPSIQGRQSPHKLLIYHALLPSSLLDRIGNLIAITGK